MRKMLLTGAGGFLGSCIATKALRKWEIHGIVRTGGTAVDGVVEHAADLTESGRIPALFETVNPDAVIHAAAMTDPNTCQRDPHSAHIINVEASIGIARQAALRGIPMIFTSSDLVFDGEHAPYREEDPVGPVSVYGEQKARAEREILKRCPRACICRMPLMFGISARRSHGFLQSWADNLRSHAELPLFTDEYRTPVGGMCAASGILLALSCEITGILHLGGKKRISRYEFGLLMARLMGIGDPNIRPGLRADVPMPAPRPADVSLDSGKAFALGYDPPPVEDDLEAALRAGGVVRHAEFSTNENPENAELR